MFPFDLPSEAQALLIPIILLLYGIILLKLKPAEEDKSQPNTMPIEAQRFPPESEGPKDLSMVTNVIRTSKQPASNPQTHRALKSARANSQNQQVEVEQGIMLDEHVRDKKKKKSFFLFGQQDFEGCRHKPGHLGTVPKNTPIPEECFGCPEILECMKCKTK